MESPILVVDDEEVIRHTLCAVLEADIDRQRFRLCVEDEGEGFDPRRVANPLDEENLDALLEGGRGVFLMRCHMDGVEYNEKGNRLCIRRRNPDAPEGT